MPLLTPIENVQPTGEEKIARQVSRLLAAPNQVKNQLITAYKQGHNLMWGNQGGVTPEERIAKLNETAAASELLAIGAALYEFLEKVLAEQDATALAEITALRAAIPAHTVKKDGTVTLD
jgi:hypothetical protein